MGERVSVAVVTVKVAEAVLPLASVAATVLPPVQPKPVQLGMTKVAVKLPDKSVVIVAGFVAG